MSARLRAPKDYSAAALSTLSVLVDGVLYGASELAEYLFAVDAPTCVEMWTLPTEDFNSYFQMVVDGVLFGKLDEGHLFAVAALDGLILSWGIETGPDGCVYAHAAPGPHGD